MNILIRKEIPSDIAKIEAVTKAAFESEKFASHTEHFIINALRTAEQLSLSMVAAVNEEIIGHVAISPVSVSSTADYWYGLGPLSVMPAQQKKGVGSLLVRNALAELSSIGASGCVVLGNPKYYSRFGFLTQANLVLVGFPPEYFQAISFDGPIPSGVVCYHHAFNK